jgi:hypothetical protein
MDRDSFLWNLVDSNSHMDSGLMLDINHLQRFHDKQSPHFSIISTSSFSLLDSANLDWTLASYPLKAAKQHSHNSAKSKSCSFRSIRIIETSRLFQDGIFSIKRHEIAAGMCSYTTFTSKYFFFVHES